MMMRYDNARSALCFCSWSEHLTYILRSRLYNSNCFTRRTAHIDYDSDHLDEADHLEHLHPSLSLWYATWQHEVDHTDQRSICRAWQIYIMLRSIHGMSDLGTIAQFFPPTAVPSSKILIPRSWQEESPTKIIERGRYFFGVDFLYEYLCLLAA